MKRKGRGAISNPAGRFSTTVVERRPEYPFETQPLATEARAEQAHTIISRNQSPDVPFSQSINPYRGCEHGCVYCYARPTHAYLDLSPGQDFETRLFYKAGAAERLREELASPSYRVSPIALGANTDPYQPIERRLKVTRQLLEVLSDSHHPVTIVTKGSLVERDIDLLACMAARRLAAVYVSITSLDAELKRTLEPRAASPKRRLTILRRLREAGIPAGVLVAPVIPALTDHDLERILRAAAEAGAQQAGYVLLRLPLEVRPLFGEWLSAHYPDRKEHVLSVLRQMHGRREYDGTYGKRQRGQGPFAQMLSDRFRTACARYGLNREQGFRLDVDRFQPPGPRGQLNLL